MIFLARRTLFVIVILSSLGMVVLPQSRLGAVDLKGENEITSLKQNQLSLQVIFSPLIESTYSDVNFSLLNVTENSLNFVMPSNDDTLTFLTSNDMVEELNQNLGELAQDTQQTRLIESYFLDEKKAQNHLLEIPESSIMLGLKLIGLGIVAKILINR